MTSNETDNGTQSLLRYTAKRDVTGALVYVFCMRADNRQMALEPLVTRALQRGEIHELIVSQSPDIDPGKPVPDVAYIGFFEIEQGGIAEVGDDVFAGDRRLGRLAGFDLTHMPNHLNVVVATDQALTGAELSLALGAPIVFRTPAGARPAPEGIHLKL
ncbi:MAG: hypothetical protein KDK91_29795 [Gammaproteobacteria bacterium]|nr:hypothetical protein [Gammaproteobacteria bacterium]